MALEIKPELNPNRDIERKIPRHNDMEMIVPASDALIDTEKKRPGAVIEGEDNHNGIPLYKEPGVQEMQSKAESKEGMPAGIDLIADLTGQVIDSKKDIDDLANKDAQEIMDAVMQTLSSEKRE